MLGAMPASPKERVYVSAFLCDNLLTEADGVISAIRLVDVHNVVLPTPEALKTFRIEGFLVVLFKSEASHELVVDVRIVSPTGGIIGPQRHRVSLAGGNTGKVLNVRVLLVAPEAGNYWFEILIGDEIVQRTPMQVNFVEQPAKQEPQGLDDQESR